MTSEPKKLVGKYLDPRAAEADHPKLDRAAPMPKAEFADITGSYAFKPADWVQCQLMLKDGEKCLQHLWRRFHHAA